MRGEQHLVHAAQLADKFFVARDGFLREDVDGGAGQMAFFERVGQRRYINDPAARGVDQARALFHGGQLAGAYHAARLVGIGHVQADDVGAFKQFFEAGQAGGVAQRQPVGNVVKNHVHAQPFGQHAQLRADMPEADDAQRLAAHLVGTPGGFEPLPAMGGHVFLGDAAHQHDDFGQHQLGYRAGVGIGGVEHGNAAPPRAGKVDLVGADAKAADGGQLVGLIQNFSADLAARADAQKVHAG